MQRRQEGKIKHTSAKSNKLRETTWYKTMFGQELYIWGFLIPNFHHVLNVVCFLLGNSAASEFYMPTFRNTLSVRSS
jgi:3-methyladenine DNA glycosylase Mpg